MRSWSHFLNADKVEYPWANNNSKISLRSSNWNSLYEHSSCLLFILRSCVYVCVCVCVLVRVSMWVCVCVCKLFFYDCVIKIQLCRPCSTPPQWPSFAESKKKSKRKILRIFSQIFSNRRKVTKMFYFICSKLVNPK